MMDFSGHRRAILRAFGGAAIAAMLTPRAKAQPAPLPDKPFAEHRIALQLSDDDPKKQGLVISVAYNLLKAYDPDKVAIEVVTFGPGIDLLRTENANRKLVESLVAQGVRFDVCLNTRRHHRARIPASGRTSSQRRRRSRSASGKFFR